MVAEFRRRRDAIVAALNTLPGFRCAMPGGAFYAFPNVTGTGMSSKDLADLLLYEAGVAALERRLRSANTAMDSCASATPTRWRT